MVKLNYVAARRQQELKDPHCRDEMAAARGALKKNATMLYTASQAFLRHPDVAATRANRDYVFKQVQEAIAGISNAAQATSPTDENKGHTGIGELAAALNEFDNKIILDPMTFSEARFRPSLEERLESIISGAALMADSSCTRDDRRERIVAECNAVRQALQDLLSEYMNNVSQLSFPYLHWPGPPCSCFHPQPAFQKSVGFALIGLGFWGGKQFFVCKWNERSFLKFLYYYLMCRCEIQNSTG
uniref:Catenin alpha-2 n=1 Tax=Anas platyrhynchos platyrhynchos TaxID=8840 RepID=A0A493TAA7_ANAPP